MSIPKLKLLPYKEYTAVLNLDNPFSDIWHSIKGKR